MNFDFSDEQKQMRDEARKFLAEKCPPKAVREVLDGKAPYDKALWQGLAEMGFLGIAIPEAGIYALPDDASEPFGGRLRRHLGSADAVLVGPGFDDGDETRATLLAGPNITRLYFHFS